MGSIGESQEGDHLASEEPLEASTMREGSEASRASARPPLSESAEAIEESGEHIDVLVDAEQEHEDDNAALLAEDEPEKHHAGTSSQKDISQPPALNRSTPPLSPLRKSAFGNLEDDAQDTVETAGEAGDVVLDSAQETQTDNAAQSAEEHDSGAEAL
jgi:hypothetical protein